MVNKKEFIVRAWNSVGANISINITDGELSYVAHWGEREDVSHNLEKHPNWKHAEELMEIVCKYHREGFLDIVKELKKSSCISQMKNGPFCTNIIIEIWTS